VITITKELLEEEDSGAHSKSKKTQQVDWKNGDKCMAIWRIDGKYYSATVDQILEDGSCTVIFDGYSSSELTQVTHFFYSSMHQI
jgi:survival-of-motor-neuron-related-splicing factor 30